MSKKTQSIACKNIMSFCSKVKYGVPQGSVLGPPCCFVLCLPYCPWVTSSNKWGWWLGVFDCSLFLPCHSYQMAWKTQNLAAGVRHGCVLGHTLQLFYTRMHGAVIHSNEFFNHCYVDNEALVVIHPIQHSGGGTHQPPSKAQLVQHWACVPSGESKK